MPIDESVSGGWRPSSFDGRDALFEHRTVALRGVPPAALLPVAHAPWDQGDVPCCVSVSVATCMEILDGRIGGVTLLSPLFNYFVARSNRSRLEEIEIRSGIKAAISYGVAAGALHNPPMTAAGAELKPSREAVADAAIRRLVGFDPRLNRFAYWALPNPADADAWRSAIAAGFPIIFGFWMTPAYLALNTNIVHGPVAGAPSLGRGHAAVAIGYSDTQAGGALLIRDSRGIAFGDRGAWWLPYTLLRTALIYEAWVLTRNTYDT